MLMKNPSGDYVQGDRDLNTSLSIDEWCAFFYSFLGAAEPEPYNEGEDIILYDERRRIAFTEPLVDYPLLARINDYYQDVYYSSNDVGQLLAECRSLENKVLNPIAKSFWNKLVSACEEALRSDMGLFLGSD